MILVTGATGTVGSRVLRELLGLGAPVCAGVHARPLEVEGVEAHAIDFDRPETLPTALEGVEAAFLASYATRHEQALVPAAVHTGVERIVKLSAWQADREEFVVGRWHREVERAIKRSGLAWTFLRPNSYMQNVVTVMGETIRNEGAIYDSVGDARISHVDTRDVAATAARVLTEPGHDGRTYELSGPETLTPPRPRRDADQGPGPTDPLRTHRRRGLPARVPAGGHGQLGGRRLRRPQPLLPHRKGQRGDRRRAPAHRPRAGLGRGLLPRHRLAARCRAARVDAPGTVGRTRLRTRDRDAR